MTETTPEVQQAVDPTAAAAEQPVGDPRPKESFLLADIERSRDYRKEYYKYSLGIAGSLLAFTLAFQPTLRTAPLNVWMELVGWAGLGVATAAGLRVHLAWSEFFITFRDHDSYGNKVTGQERRRRWTRERRVLDFLLAAGLIVGIAGVIGFTVTNLHNIAVKTGA